MTADESLLAKVAEQMSVGTRGSGPGSKGSILAASAASYAIMPQDDDADELTQPTGFDPLAAVLFEAVVESAFLVANADGTFDDAERSTFEHVVHSACSDYVGVDKIEALVADLAQMLEEDGIDQRITMVAKTIQKPEQAREALRIAALIAHISEGVSDVERGVLDKLAAAFGLDTAALDTALGEVKQALGN